MRSCLTILAAVAPCVARAQSPQLSAGMGIQLEVALGASAFGAERGARPVLRVAQPVVVDGVTLVAAGTAVFTTLVPAAVPTERARIFALVVDSTFAVDGTRVLVDGPQVADTVGTSISAYVGNDVSALGRCDRLVVRVRTSVPVRAVDRPVARPAPAIPPCALGERERRLASRRSALAAGLWDYFVPGVGHLRAGDRRRGVALLVTALTGSMLMTVPRYDERTGRWKYEGAAGVGAVLWFGSAIYGVADASRAVRRHNERMIVGP